MFGLLAGMAIFLVAVNKPDDDSYFPRCTLHNLTGLHCPGCGMTRSLHSALNGDFAQALSYNILAPIILPVFFVSISRSLWSWVRGRKLVRSANPPRKWKTYLPIILGSLLVIFFVLRNIPVYPLTLLAPHELTP